MLNLLWHRLRNSALSTFSGLGAKDVKLSTPLKLTAIKNPIINSPSIRKTHIFSSIILIIKRVTDYLINYPKANTYNFDYLLK